MYSVGEVDIRPSITILSVRGLFCGVILPRGVHLCIKRHQELLVTIITYFRALENGF